jgi:glycosyltransferase involved in cell wall biosynthesis
MKAETTDVLMITYNRAAYTRLSLTSLLDRCDDDMRVWIWQNGSDPDTMAVVDDLRSHPGVFRYHHSLENQGLNAPTNWLWSEAEGEYLSKVDDDCIVPDDWGPRLRQAHREVPEFGVIGCWRFQEEDFIPELAEKKIRRFSGGHALLVNLWVEGSGYLMKRACLEANGLLRERQTFTEYCIALGIKGWCNGWLYPFLYQEHMDDPRALHTGLRTDADLQTFLPLSAARNRVATLSEWDAQLRRSARVVQEASPDPAYWKPWRRGLRRAKTRAKRALGGRRRHR